ncbi:DUF2637 domain-containing protein [Kitasatospora sp. NPDC002965]|uniref:DUF2637 domain-containing protein n=1 Tax=Kitasatospora sp. NPDC002965 TaxID=3154775 RepID=UPI0033B1B4CC
MSKGEPVARPVLKTIHRWMIGGIAAGALLIAAIGLGGSYLAVRDVASDQGMGDFANVFPIGIDAGIIILLALDLLLTWLRIPFPLLRPTAWLLTVATIAFNAAASWPNPLGVGMHAAIPVLFVIISEAGRHAIARLARLSSDRSIEKIRTMRWVLAPVQTWRLWRRMQLWEIRSLDEAIHGEQARLTYKVLVRRRRGFRPSTGDPESRKRQKLVPEARLPLQLADLGVPMAVTYEAGLAAVGVDAEPLSRLLAHQERARQLATSPRQGDQAIAHAQPRPGEIAQRKALAQPEPEPTAQDDLAQGSSAQAPESDVEQAASAQSNPVFVQVKGHVPVIAQMEPEQAEEPFGLARHSEAPAGAIPEDDLLRIGHAHGAPAAPAAQNAVAQPATEAVAEDWHPAAAQPVPAARVSALGSAAGPVVTQQTDDILRIPSGWAEGFFTFVTERQRHPEQSELADFLHTRGFKSNKAGDGPVSADSVRRYYNQLCERFPTPEDPIQPSLDLQDMRV